MQRNMQIADCFIYKQFIPELNCKNAENNSAIYCSKSEESADSMVYHSRSLAKAADKINMTLKFGWGL